MPDIWQQFHRLPRRIRDAVATPTALDAVDRLEQQYPNLDAAGLVMRVMAKSVSIDQLVDTVATGADVDAATAEKIANTLRQEVFQGVGEYLGLTPAAPANPKAAAATPADQAGARKPAGPATPAPAPLAPISPPAAASTGTLKIPPPSVPAPAKPVGSNAPTQAFSEEEEKEIADQAQRLQRLSAPDAAVDLDDLARQVIDQHQLAFSEELLSKRAIAILKARLKDIRQSDETQAMLARDPKVGGLGLDPDQAALVTASLEQRVQDLKSRGMVAPRSVPQPPPPPRVPEVAQSRPEPKPPLRPLSEEPSLPAPPPIPKVADQSRPSLPIRRPPDLPPPPPMKVTELPPAPATPTLQRSRVLERPKVADVTRPSRTYGPAEELRSLTLAEFRRLGQGANDSTRRLLGTFQHLQQESFKLWADAVSGWRQSELHQLYLDTGRQSLEENIGIAEVIQRRARQNLPYLSEHEFTALADLNRQLQS